MNASMLSETEMSGSKWKTIMIGDEKYSVCATKDDGTWKVSLTNLIEMWTENLDRQQILHKCEKLNPNLCTEDMDVQQFVSLILDDIPRYATEASTERILLNSELEGGIFEFAVDFVKASPSELWNRVTKPLCLAAGELRRQQTILLDLVKKKDVEISEYRLNGAELIRKHIRTEPFDKILFEKDRPNITADSCQSVFQTIMEMRDVEAKSFVKHESSEEICSAAVVDGLETSVKIEAEEPLADKNVVLVTDNEIPSNIEDKPNLEMPIRSTIELVPKTEIKNNASETIESTKPIKTVMKIDNHKNSYLPNRTTLPVKRSKKDIHDFIK